MSPLRCERTALKLFSLFLGQVALLLDGCQRAGRFDVTSKLFYNGHAVGTRRVRQGQRYEPGKRVARNSREEKTELNGVQESACSARFV